MTVYLQEEYEMLATNDIFMKRVRMGFVHIAKEVLAENTSVDNSILRKSFARGIMSNESLNDRVYIATIATDTNVIAAAVAKWVATAPASRDANTAQSGITNEQILQAIRDIWNILAGV